MRVPIVPILSTLQLHSGVVCCSPLPCAIMCVPRLFLVCLACPICTIFYIFTDLRREKQCTWNVSDSSPAFHLLITCFMPVLSLLFRCYPHHRARLLPRPACVTSIKGRKYIFVFVLHYLHHLHYLHRFFRNCI